MSDYTLLYADAIVWNRQETRDIEKPSNRLPVGLALATNGTACVTWMGNNNRSDIILYARDIKKMAQDSCGK